MLQNDSVEKVITRYFAAVSKVSFTYGGTVYPRKPLRVTPNLLRGYTCPAMCGGCCFNFSLDYLPSEMELTRPLASIPQKQRFVEFNGKNIEIWTDWQKENTSNRCKNLNPKDGRCRIHGWHPFTCDFELIRTLAFEDASRPNVLTQKLYGRGWSYPRVDGGKGALCEMTPPTKETIADVIRKLERLKQWTDHFGLTKTWIPEIIQLIKSGALQKSDAITLEVSSGTVGFGL